MTSVQPISLESRIRLGMLCAILLPTGLYFIWMTWIGFEALYIIRTGSLIDAKIERLSEYKRTYSGIISFGFTRDDREYKCVAHEHLGGESLQLRLGQLIKVVPRADCGRPVVISAVRVPGFFLVFTLICVASLWTLTKALYRGHW